MRPLRTALLLTALWAFFGVFLYYPLWTVLQGAFWDQGHLTVAFLRELLRNPLTYEALVNSAQMGLMAT